MSTTSLGLFYLDNNSSLQPADQEQLTSGDVPHISYPGSICVPELVAHQAKLHPENIALWAPNETMSYGQLELRANQLANLLRSLGATRDAPVAICLPRSVAFTVSALAVLKSGAAYVPLDPAQPPERLTWMLRDANPMALLTRERIAKNLMAGPWHTIHLDSDSKRISAHSGNANGHSSNPGDLAYVIYTSGSTGQPKGVQITHDSLLNLVCWHQRTFAVGSKDRATQLASPGFDAAVWEIWPYLTAGAGLCIPADNVRHDPESLRDFLIAHHITVAFAPTPIAERLIGLEWPDSVSLRLLLTGADTLHIYPPATLPFQLVNNYGPTECTVVTTSGIVDPQRGGERRPSIGHPISNVQIYILDEGQEEAPIGTPGEIYIGGAGVARGYINDADLTSEKFIANPFGKGQLYRSGDLGRYLPEGAIDFLGRIDEQIKSRGFRIEPNEIIAALASHSMIQTSYVMAREKAANDKQLVAYIVLKAGSRPTDRELREFLATQLPDYMVPDIFVRIDSLPLNSSGKIDRTALAAPDQTNCLDMDEHVSARTALEEQVAKMISTLLGLEKVSVEENFFLLGGHSLLGTQLIARIRRVFGVELTLRTLFECSTVATLSAEIEHLLYFRVQAMSEEEARQLLGGTNSAGSGEN